MMKYPCLKLNKESSANAITVNIDQYFRPKVSHHFRAVRMANESEICHSMIINRDQSRTLGDEPS